MLRSLLPLASLLLACRLLPAPTPMAAQVDRLAPAPARCLMVLLPGAGDRMGKFAEEGFIAAIRATGASVDLVAANATMGYYFRGTVADRLERDVFAPHRPGHERVWILGVSMGGFGALHYASQHADSVDGVIVLAPYLGDRDLAAEIQRAGGLARWTPDPPAPPTRRTYQRQLWSWLHRATAPDARAPALFVGHGDDDIKTAGRVLAAALPADHVFHAPGGHDWPVWRGLLRTILAHPEFTRSCAAP